MTKLLNRDFYQPQSLDGISGVFSGVERMRRALEAVQGESLQALKGIEKELAPNIWNPRWLLEKLHIFGKSDLRQIVGEMRQQWEEIKFNKTEQGSIVDAQNNLQQTVSRLMDHAGELAPSLGGTKHSDFSAQLSEQIAVAKTEIARGELSTQRLSIIQRLASRMVTTDTMAAKSLYYVTLATPNKTMAVLGAPAGMAPASSNFLTNFSIGISQKFSEFKDHWTTIRLAAAQEGFVARTVGAGMAALSKTFGGTLSADQLWDVNQRMLGLDDPTVPVVDAPRGPSPQIHQMSWSDGNAALGVGGVVQPISPDGQPVGPRVHTLANATAALNAADNDSNLPPAHISSSGSRGEKCNRLAAAEPGIKNF